MRLTCILKTYFETYTLKVAGEGCKILRERAMEVMVWVLVDKDKNSKLEITCSLPTAYELQDYSLNSQAFRNTTEEVLKESRQREICVLSFATDDQWIQNMMDKRNQ